MSDKPTRRQAIRIGIGGLIGAIIGPPASRSARKANHIPEKPDDFEKDVTHGAIAGAALVAVVDGAARGAFTPDTSISDDEKRRRWQEREDANRKDREDRNRDD